MMPDEMTQYQSFVNDQQKFCQSIVNEIDKFCQSFVNEIHWHNFLKCFVNEIQFGQIYATIWLAANLALCGEEQGLKPCTETLNLGLKPRSRGRCNGGWAERSLLNSI